MLSFFTNSIFSKLLIVVLCSLLIATPLSQALAQELTHQDPDAGIIIQQAEADAEADVNGTIYGIGGFLCGIFGWLAAIISSAEVPAVRLVGKSSNYVVVYTQTYQDKAKSIKTKAACTGWAIGSAVSLIYFLAAGTTTTTK